jgi:hypothetical protein
VFRRFSMYVHGYQLDGVCGSCFRTSKLTGSAAIR